MRQKLASALLLVILGGVLGFFVYKSEPRLNANFANESSFFQDYPFRLGLDLSGGTHLVYKADVSALGEVDVGESMDALRDVIERRVNLFGVSEPIVQVKRAGFVSGEEEQLIVDLPGVTDVTEAIEMIGQTPLLEFKVEVPEGEQKVVVPDANGNIDLGVIDSNFKSTELTGRYLKRATLEFDPNTREPVVSLQFDDTGTKLFSTITKQNIGRMVAIYLDGSIISSPVVREEIPNGQAVISGGFNPAEARTLVGRLNSGALPVPIELVSTQTIGAILGDKALHEGVYAALIGFILVVAYLIFWYRLPGLVASLALCVFVVTVLSIFKIIPVTLTATGIAGFIISLGIAVDANVLIFERIKEELRSGKVVADAFTFGFERAWLAIRDSSIANLLAATILFSFGTPLIKGFALTLGIGVSVSILSAFFVTRILLSLLVGLGENKVTRFLWSSGVSK